MSNRNVYLDTHRKGMANSAIVHVVIWVQNLKELHGEVKTLMFRLINILLEDGNYHIMKMVWMVLFWQNNGQGRAWFVHISHRNVYLDTVRMPRTVLKLQLVDTGQNNVEQ
jgi:hypothetical protein